MTVTVMRANKPARYQMGNDGRTHLIEDEDQSTATPAIPSTDEFAKALDLVTAAAHATTTEKRIAEIADAAAKARDTIAEAKAAAADLARINREIEAAEKQSADKIAAETAEWRRTRDAGQREIDSQRQAADKREAELEKREANLKAERAKLDRKLVAVRQAAAE